MNHQFKPVFFRLSEENDLNRFNELIKSKPFIHQYDTIDQQLIELYKVRFPDKLFVDEMDYKEFLSKEVNGLDLKSYGTWVYYPWTDRLIHLLDENEFFEVRTNRNNNKISLLEQDKLRKKTVGIIGLSVGQSVAMTIAMERICGKLKLADFDTIELSNLNRIRTSVHNLGLSKVVTVAREIAEIDPYIEVDIFPEGLNKENISEFLGGHSGKLDVLLELCDSIEIKLSSRIAAREQGIPVVMETNDRCMVDIERFDLEPNRPILHGLVEGVDVINFNQLSGPEKLELVLKIVDKDRLSSRMTEAFTQIGKTIRSWPQLASSVTMGAGVSTDIVRRILLDEKCESGRWYFDVDDILAEESVVFAN